MSNSYTEPTRVANFLANTVSMISMFIGAGMIMFLVPTGHGMMLYYESALFDGAGFTLAFLGLTGLVFFHPKTRSGAIVPFGLMTIAMLVTVYGASNIPSRHVVHHHIAARR